MSIGDKFNLVIIALNVLACLTYGINSEWVKAIYWLGGTLLTGAAFFMK